MSDPTEYFDLLQSGARDGALIAALRAQLAEFESESDNLAARASLSATAQAVVRDRLSRLGYIGQDAVSSQTCASGANQTDD